MKQFALVTSVHNEVLESLFDTRIMPLTKNPGSTAFVSFLLQSPIPRSTQKPKRYIHLCPPQIGSSEIVPVAPVAPVPETPIWEFPKTGDPNIVP